MEFVGYVLHVIILYHNVQNVVKIMIVKIVKWVITYIYIVHLWIEQTVSLARQVYLVVNAVQIKVNVGNVEKI
jgi:hypothetical protein